MKMIKLSVNVNKIATLRNARGEQSPSVVDFSVASIQAGAHGITVHPRPDERHIRYQDVLDLREVITAPIEYNIEGYPDQRYLNLIQAIYPDQATLVPDAPNVITSHMGWNVIQHQAQLKDVVCELKQSAKRVSIFIDTNLNQIDAAKQIGADRIELYTKRFADAFAQHQGELVFAEFATAAAHATKIGLGVNAGHDLNLANLKLLHQLPGLLEVSIGHALVCDALVMGWRQAIEAYLNVLSGINIEPHMTSYSFGNFLEMIS